MRGLSDPQSDLFSDVSLESRDLDDHRPRRFHQLGLVMMNRPYRPRRREKDAPWSIG